MDVCVFVKIKNNLGFVSVVPKLKKKEKKKENHSRDNM